MSQVMVLGLGYVGLPLAVRAAEVGHDVVGVDLDPDRVGMLQACRSYTEDVTDERLAAVTTSGRFSARLGWGTDLPEDPDPDLGFDIALITVPTPLKLGVPDLSYVESAGRMVGSVLRRNAAVVLESTTYPGTAEGLLAETLAEASGLVSGVDFHLGFSPERIDPGSKIHTLENTPKLVSATTPAGLDVIESFYGTIVERTVPVSSPRVAEMSKVFENTQAYVNIALINELSEICHDLDIDVHEMLDAAMTKGHSMAHWVPGPGVGGHCLPIDPMYLAWQTRTWLGRPFRFAELANEINQCRPEYVVRRTIELLRDCDLPVRGAEVLVLGLAYKPGVADLRESPSVEVVKALTGCGAAVTVCDPHVPSWSLTPMIELEDLTCAIERFALVVITTDHPEFDYDKIAREARLVLDCRHSVPPAANVVAL
jgi:UDP-N-acetyl-D-glucosamine dehydrogenase